MPTRKFNSVTESLQSRDLRSSRRAFKYLLKFIASAEIETQNSLDFCVQPVEELRKQQNEVYKVYGYGEASRHIIPRTGVTIGKTSTAAALFYGSSNGLEYRSHRFTFVGKELDYHREPYNIDCQSLGSHTMNLAGIRIIASEPTARNELLWLADYLEGTQPDSWTPKPVRTVAC